MIRDLNITASLIRQVTVSGLAVAVNDAPDPALAFRAQLTLPRTPRLDLDGAPRKTRPHLLRWPMGPVGPDQSRIEPGARFQLSRPGGKSYENAVYEVIEAPRIVRLGAQDLGAETNLYEVSGLYPLVGVPVSDNGVVVGNVSVSLSTGEKQVHLDTGTYQDFTGYASVADFGFFKQNAVLTIAGKRYRLTWALIDYETLRTRFGARLSNAF